MATSAFDNRAVDASPGVKKGLNDGHVHNKCSSTQEDQSVVNHDQSITVVREKLSDKAAGTVGSMTEQSTLVAEAEGAKRPSEQIQVEAAERVTPEPTGRSSKPKRDDMNIVSSSDKEGNVESPVPPSFVGSVANVDTSPGEATSSSDTAIDHSPTSLPRFKEPNTCMWTASYAANAPSEDRSASLVNVLLRPLNEASVGDSKHPLVRLSLWSVIDGHGGGCVATYASEVLLPHIVGSLSRSLECDIVHRGECRVNGELRDANAIDFDGIIRSNPNSIHYKTPSEDSDDDDIDSYYTPPSSLDADADKSLPMEQGDDCYPSDESELSLASSLSPKEDMSYSLESSPKTSVKTAPHAKQAGPAGTHSTDEVARVTRAITESFCAVDEGWINSIDVATTRQTACQNNGSWNAGACALVVFTIQRLEWGEDTSHCQDATTECFGSEVKCAASSLSTISSTSSLSATVEHKSKDSDGNELARTEKPEIVDTGGQDPPPSGQEFASREELRIYTPGGCGCHFYRPHDPMLYTAHVGDCRAVLLGDAPPTTIEVPPDSKVPVDSADDGDSNNEAESRSSSEQDEVSSDEEDFVYHETSLFAKPPPHMRYMNHPSRRMCITRTGVSDRQHRPFLALPPLENMKESSSSSESSDDGQPARKVPRRNDGANINQRYKAPLGEDNAADAHPAILNLPPHVRPIDLTTDHSAYNLQECAAVLRRCNNAPKAISTGLSGGIRRVAGSLAITRALGDAYLKTPLLSFFPYKRHAPYITARPEVNCRLISWDRDPKKNSSVLILASDGVWENCEGEDVLRWIRNYAAERSAAAVAKSSRSDGHSTIGDTLDLESVACENEAYLKKRKRRRQGRELLAKTGGSYHPTSADVVLRRVLNRVCRSKNMSVQDLLALPKGRARRLKHDDITTTVVDLNAFVM